MAVTPRQPVVGGVIARASPPSAKPSKHHVCKKRGHGYCTVKRRRGPRGASGTSPKDGFQHHRRSKPDQNAGREHLPAVRKVAHGISMEFLF